MNNSSNQIALLLLVSMTAVKIASDGRGYYTASFQDPSNPFAKTVSRNFWQQFNAAGEPVWRGADPAVVTKFIGKTIPGEILSKEVVPYTIPRADGTEQTVNTYTTVVLGGENIKSTFKAQGHELAEEAIAAQPQLAENPLAGDVDIA